MSYCLNPHCPHPLNPESTKFCQTCGTKLLLTGQYRAIKLIGSGGFGRTLLAEDEYKPSKPRCVIKQFYPQGQNNATKAVQLFNEEAIRLNKLGKHSQIPELFAHCEQDNYQYIVQEFIDGQNLAQELLETGAFREDKIRNLLIDLLPVLKFIHTGQVIHRDIKPDNLIRRRWDGKLVLVDFGAAKYATRTALAKTGTTIGSAGYAAPEQSFGKAVFASDLYSLGVTCIHLLTQIEPFDLYDALESGFVWRHYLVNNPVSDELADILDKMVQSSVKQRYQFADEVMQALGIFGRTYSNNGAALLPPPRQLASPKIASVNVSLVNTLSGHSKAVHTVAFSPDKQTLASGSRDKMIKLWQVRTAKEIRTLGNWFSKHSDVVNVVMFSPNGQILASRSGDRSIKLWDVRTGQQLRTLGRHSDVVYAVAFSLDGQKLRIIKRRSTAFESFAFSPDVQILASGNSYGMIKLWNVSTGQKIRTLHGHTTAINSVAFSLDGKTLASGSLDNTIKLWNVSTGQKIRTLRGHLNAVNSVAFSSDGQTLASSSADTTVKLWDVPTGQELCLLKGHSNAVNSVAFSPDGQTLASGSADTTIKLWQVTR